MLRPASEAAAIESTHPPTMTDANDTDRDDTDYREGDLETMLAAIRPDWRLRAAEAAEAGHHPVYRLRAATPAGERTCYLKTTPPDLDPTVDLEARLLAALDRHTGIPVPAVLGVVDERDDLPAPFVLTEAMSGTVRHRRDLATIDPAVLRGIARDAGRYVAELHALDAVDAYGYLHHDGPALDGEAPAGDLDAIVVADPIPDWRERLHDWADGTLDRVGETRFADVVPEAEPVLRDRVDAVEGPFEPVLARIDQALENGLVAGDDLVAMLDWGFTIAATPAYDVHSVAWNLAAGPYLLDPDLPDRRPLVYQAVAAGYRERGDSDVLDRLRANRPCYDLLTALRSMVHLTDWEAQFEFGVGEDEAAAQLREDLREVL